MSNKEKENDASEEAGEVLEQADISERKEAEPQLPVIRSEELEQAVPERLFSLASVLAMMIERSFTLLAHILSRVKSEELYKDKGYKTFAAYVQAELAFGRRKADYLVNIHDKMIKTLGIPKERVEELGWSKAKELIPVIDATNKDDLMGDAEDLNLDDLRTKVTRMRRGLAPSGDIHHVRFILDPGQRDNLDHALSLAADLCKKAGKPSESKNHLIDMIALHFASSNIQDVSDDSLGTFIDTLERRFGGKILFLKDEEMAKAVLEAIAKAEAIDGETTIDLPKS